MTIRKMMDTVAADYAFGSTGLVMRFGTLREVLENRSRGHADGLVVATPVGHRTF